MPPTTFINEEGKGPADDLVNGAEREGSVSRRREAISWNITVLTRFPASFCVFVPHDRTHTHARL